MDMSQYQAALYEPKDVTRKYGVNKTAVSQLKKKDEYGYTD